MMRNIKNILKRLSWWFVSALWLAMVITLITGAHNSPRGGLRVPEELLAGVHLADESTWMGIYINSHKIGYIHTELEPLKPHGYEIREFSSLQGAMMGVMQQMRMRMTVITDSTLALISFEGRLETDLYLTVFKGLIEDRVLKIEVTTGGRKSDKFIPAPEPIYISQAIKPLLHAGRLDESDSLKLAGFDPVRLEMQDLVVIGAKLEPQRLWGEDVMVRKLTTRLAGFESTLYVDNEGNTLVEYGPLGMMMRREEMDVALTVEDDRSSVDFLAIYSIKPEGSIRAPRKNQLGVYCVYGFDITKAAKSSDRQQIINAEKSVIRVANKPEKSTESLKTLKKFTRDAPYIESRENIIKLTAKNAVMGAKSRKDSLNKLTSWVFHAVNKRPSAGLPSALAVLHQLEGDCNEHSVLFTALARSLGIPTKIQLGVVYQRGRFFYHAWTASWVDDRWEEFDPTFGQKRADAARIALASGDLSDSIELVEAIGNIEIEILEVR